MLTPKHRALFAAAYEGAILRNPGEEPEPPPTGSVPGETPAAKEDDSGAEKRSA
jgi:hypothetical protein